MIKQEPNKKLEIRLSKGYKSTKANEDKLKKYLENVKRPHSRNV